MFIEICVFNYVMVLMIVARWMIVGNKKKRGLQWRLRLGGQQTSWHAETRRPDKRTLTSRWIFVG